MLEFMRPAGALRGLLGDNWTAWVDEGSRYALGPARGTHTPQHARPGSAHKNDPARMCAEIGRGKEFAT